MPEKPEPVAPQPAKYPAWMKPIPLRQRVINCARQRKIFMRQRRDHEAKLAARGAVKG